MDVCPGPVGSKGVPCPTGECCGAHGMSPMCLTNSSLQCCQHYADAAACLKTETCCGGLSGAASFSMCCEVGTFCCGEGADTSGTCCADGDKCCSSPYATNKWCCPPSATCGTNQTSAGRCL
eukprot:Sspe_Gene.100009::Locus_74380_Transcript_1_1_Confidence_1.000_Length_1606::g.100009::m.100009